MSRRDGWWQPIPNQLEDMLRRLLVTNAPQLSSGGPPSVPSRISVVLVEEAKAGGTPRLDCPSDDQDIRLLAGVAKPASVTFYDDILGSPCVGGTLSSSNIARRLLPVVHAMISFPVGPTLAQMARLLQVARLAHLGRCPHLTLLARMLQGGACWPRRDVVPVSL